MAQWGSSYCLQPAAGETEAQRCGLACFKAIQWIRSRARKKALSPSSLAPLITGWYSSHSKIWNVASVYSYHHSLMNETPHHLWERNTVAFWCSAICGLEKLWFLCQNQQQDGSPYSWHTAKKTLLNCLWATALFKAHWYIYQCLLSLEQKTNHSASLKKKSAFSSCHLHIVGFSGNLQVFSICSSILLWTCFIKFAKGFKWFRSLKVILKELTFSSRCCRTSGLKSHSLLKNAEINPICSHRLSVIFCFVVFLKA